MRLFSCADRSLICGFALCFILLISGCVAPGYPYVYPTYGNSPYGAVAPPKGAMLQSVPPSYPQVYAPGVAMTGPGYQYPYVYAPAPALIAPTFFVGAGNGYWYGNSFWPYRSGCAFYGGRYYGGYGTNYWRRGYGSWQGGNYHGGNQNWQGYHGGYWNR